MSLIYKHCRSAIVDQWLPESDVSRRSASRRLRQFAVISANDLVDHRHIVGHPSDRKKRVSILRASFCAQQKRNTLSTLRRPCSIPFRFAFFGRARTAPLRPPQCTACPVSCTVARNRSRLNVEERNSIRPHNEL